MSPPAATNVPTLWSAGWTLKLLRVCSSLGRDAAHPDGRRVPGTRQLQSRRPWLPLLSPEFPAGVILARPPLLGPHKACSLLGLASYEGAHRESDTAVDFPDASLSLVDTLGEFHRVNLDAAAGRFPGLNIPGRELMPGVIVGRKTRLPVSAIKGKPVFVGSRCRIAANAELMSEVVVSSDVVIDRGAILRSAVIMPHTYIGELVEVADAIVAGNELIHVITGAHNRVSDSFLLASVHTQGLASLLRTALDSVLAILLLIVSLPLWPIALLVSYAAVCGSSASPFNLAR